MEDGFIEVVEVAEDELFEDIDRGEAAALRYALDVDADLVLLDEKEARQVARRHGLNITGVIGVLLRGAKNGRIEMKEEIRKLRSEGFWLSDDLVNKIIDEV